MFQHTTILPRPDALHPDKGDNMSALSTTYHNDGITTAFYRALRNSFLPLCRLAAFYRVNVYLKPEVYVCHNISNSTHQQYLTTIRPAMPSRFGQRYYCSDDDARYLPVNAIIIMNLCYPIMCAT